MSTYMYYTSYTWFNLPLIPNYTINYRRKCKVNYLRCFETFPNVCGLSLELPCSSISIFYPSNCMFVCYAAVSLAAFSFPFWFPNSWRRTYMTHWSVLLSFHIFCWFYCLLPFFESCGQPTFLLTKHKKLFLQHTNGDPPPQKKELSLKKKIYLHFEQKHLIPLKILSNGGKTLVQSFFPLCEASLELLKLDVVECLLRSCFHLLHGATSLSFLSFFIFGNKKK